MNMFKYFTHGISAQIKSARGWIYLGWMDFIVPYRSTYVGPVWELLSAVVWVLGLSLVFYSPEFSSVSRFVAYVACGIVFFTFTSHTLTQFPSLYLTSGEVMQSIAISPAFFILRTFVLNLLRFASQFVVAIGAVWFFADITEVQIFEFIPGMFVLVNTSLWVGIILASLGARFPDMVQVISTLARTLMFVTPVFWSVGDSQARDIVASYNPITYFIEIVRAPLLGEHVRDVAWIVVISINLALIPIALITYKMVRHRILKWV